MDGSAFDDGDTSSEENDGFSEEFADASSRRDAGEAGPSNAHDQYTSAFVNHKAGMDGVDKAHVRRVVDEMSKNSAHYRNESRKEAKVEARRDGAAAAGRGGTKARATRDAYDDACSKQFVEYYLLAAVEPRGEVGRQIDARVGLQRELLRRAVSYDVAPLLRDGS